MAKQFVWLMDNQSPRHGPELRKGETYNVDDFREDVVNHWVKQGVAKYKGDKPKSKNGGK